MCSTLITNYITFTGSRLASSLAGIIINMVQGESPGTQNVGGQQKQVALTE